jgi:hypothetical protein
VSWPVRIERDPAHQRVPGPLNILLIPRGTAIKRTEQPQSAAAPRDCQVNAAKDPAGIARIDRESLDAPADRTD